jgi:hypothetical protein
MSGIIKLNGMNYRIVDVKNDSIWGHVIKIRADNGDVLGYKVINNVAYFSGRYKKWIGAEAGDRSDGATYAKDINTFAWLFHDELCNDGTFEDGTPCNNLQASAICGDLLAISGRWFRRYTWFVGTWFFGGGEARENGMM